LVGAKVGNLVGDRVAPSTEGDADGDSDGNTVIPPSDGTGVDVLMGAVVGGAVVSSVGD
jgi:hypothetical protein